MLTTETLEWIEKAEGDYRIASRERHVTDAPVYSVNMLPTYRKNLRSQNAISDPFFQDFNN